MLGEWRRGSKAWPVQAYMGKGWQFILISKPMGYLSFLLQSTCESYPLHSLHTCWLLVNIFATMLLHMENPVCNYPACHKTISWEIRKILKEIHIRLLRWDRSKKKSTFRDIIITTEQDKWPEWRYHSQRSMTIQNYQWQLRGIVITLMNANVLPEDVCHLRIVC